MFCCCFCLKNARSCSSTERTRNSSEGGSQSLRDATGAAREPGLCPTGRCLAELFKRSKRFLVVINVWWRYKNRINVAVSYVVFKILSHSQEKPQCWLFCPSQQIPIVLIYLYDIYKVLKTALPMWCPRLTDLMCNGVHMGIHFRMCDFTHTMSDFTRLWCLHGD